MCKIEHIIQKIRSLCKAQLTKISQFYTLRLVKEFVKKLKKINLQKGGMGAGFGYILIIMIMLTLGSWLMVGAFPPDNPSTNPPTGTPPPGVQLDSGTVATSSADTATDSATTP